MTKNNPRVRGRPNDFSKCFKNYRKTRDGTALFRLFFNLGLLSPWLGGGTGGRDQNGPKLKSRYYDKHFKIDEQTSKLACPLGKGVLDPRMPYFVFGGAFDKENVRARPPLGPPETKLGGPMSGAGAHQL